MKRLLLCMSLALVLSFGASAATMTVTDFVTAEGVYNPMDLTGTFELDQFNSSLGTLTGVQIAYTVFWNDTDISIKNNSTGSATFSADGGLRSTLTGSTIVGSPVLFYSIIGATPGDVTLASGDTLVLADDAAGSDARALTPTGLAAFIGSGTVAYDLLVTNYGTMSWTGSGLESSETAFAYGRMDITYTYNDGDVPEPATATLAGFGLLLAGFLGRRFARS
jgi:hypothetical protein